MNPHQIVVRKVKRDSRFQVLQLFAESIGESSKSPVCGELLILGKSVIRHTQDIDSFSDIQLVKIKRHFQRLLESFA